MSLTCELSGEPLATTTEEVVATPSGHVCLKRLILSKMAENGSTDPFEPIRQVPLSEDQLITLRTSRSNSKAPPRPQATSLPNLLQNIQSEYDALVLELFDTRKALEATRQELSQALYQNDAAIRVVARLSMERDAARHELERWTASANGGTTAAKSRSPVEEEPEPKRRKTTEPRSSEPLKNDIPQVDLDTMVEVWQSLNPQRKPTLKAAATVAPSPEDLANYTETTSKAWHKSTCRNLSCMAAAGGLLVTAGKDKQVLVYHTDKHVVHQTFAFGSLATCVDVSKQVVVAGDENGKVDIYSVDTGSTIGEYTAEAAVVDVRIHPSGKHICAATADGKILVLYLVDETKVQLVAYFEGDEASEYTCGALHPDGLLYAAGTSKGQVHMWDFKNKVLASTLQEGDKEDAVVCVAFSNNGYHLATSDESAVVRFWDLRKQKKIATLNAEKDLLESVTAIAYDDSGKYVAFGGKGGLKVTTVKEWGTTANIEVNKPISGIIWSKSTLAVCSDKERKVRFFGLA